MPHTGHRAIPAVTLTALALLAAGCASSGSGSSGARTTSATSSPASATTSASSALTSASSASASSASPSPALTGSITVFGAASLTGAFTTLGQQFQAAHPGASVRFSFGASSMLAQQVVAGAPADVFASASPKDMSTVTSAGDASDPQTFATNSAEVAVAPASASRVTSITDLSRAGVKVALCQPQVPCGALAQTVLEKAGVAVKPVTLGLDVKSTLAYVTSGQADAAIVYVTDVKAAGTKVTGVVVPAGDNATTAYPIAVTKDARDAPLATAFEQYVLSPAGRSVLAQAGFAAP